MPVWSPDSEHLIIRGRLADDPGSLDWWIVPADGTAPVRTHAVENLAPLGIVHYPVGWIGNTIYYAAGTTIEGVNLFRVPIDPKDRTIRGPAERITSGPGMKIYPTVMPDGRIFFTNMTAEIGAWSVTARPDEAAVSATPEKLTKDLMQKFSPSVSRDGTRAAFIAFGGEKESRIEVRMKDLRTGQETAIPLQGVNLGNTVLSPDGSVLAYQDRVAGKLRSFILAPGAAAGREICEGCAIFGFFPDNRSVLVQTVPREIEKLDLQTGKRTAVLASRYPRTGNGSPGTPASRTAARPSASIRPKRPKEADRERSRSPRPAISWALPPGRPTAAIFIISPRRTGDARSSSGSSTPGPKGPWPKSARSSSLRTAGS